MRHAATKAVYGHWLRLRGDRGAPVRRDIDPAALSAWLADVFLIERVDGLVRFRLAGTRVCALFGAELRGRRVDSLFAHAAAEDAAEMLASAFDDRAPVIAGLAALFPERVSIEAEMLLLPLADGDGAPGGPILGVLAAAGRAPALHGPCAALDVIAFRILSDADADAGAARLPHRHTDSPALRRARFRIYDGGLR